MNYVYCGNYSVMYFALHLLDKGEEVAIITRDESLERFCDFAGIKCIRFDTDGGRHYRLSDAFRLLAKRRYLDGLLRSLDIQGDDVLYFVSPMSDYNCFYLAKQWARRGKVRIAPEETIYTPLTYYEPVSDRGEPGHGKARVPTRLRRTKLLLRLFLGLELTIYDFAGFSMVLGVDDGFLRENGIERVAIEPLDQLVLESMDKHSVSVGEYDSLLASGYRVITSSIEPNSLRELYRKVGQIAPNMAVKCHPVVTKYNEYQREVERFFQGFQVLPTYLPAELLFKSIKSNVLSVHSLTLALAAKTDHLRAISLMDLVEYKDRRKGLRDTIRRKLKEASGDRIIFPKDFVELERLLLP